MDFLLADMTDYQLLSELASRYPHCLFIGSQPREIEPLAPDDESHVPLFVRGQGLTSTLVFDMHRAELEMILAGKPYMKLVPNYSEADELDPTFGDDREEDYP